MKKYFFLFTILLSISSYSQRPISLEEAISIAQKNSPDYKALLNQNQASYWRYRNFKARFLPQLRFDATLPQYRNSVNRITLDDGSDGFRRTNQIRFDGTLSINQNIGLTGGTISVSFLSAITTPAACVATLRFNPSSFNERSVNFFTLGSSFTSFCNLGSPAIH